MKYYPDKSSILDTQLWYGFKRAFSFAVRHIYLIGGRRRGKSYGVKQLFINDFVKNGNKFFWCRSTDRALLKISSTNRFFGRIKNLKELGVNEYKIENKTIYINGKEAGFLFAVNTYFNEKGVEYDCVNGCYDEFMRASGEKPIADRREKYNNLIESATREGGKWMFYLANALNKYDEMLSEFKVNLDKHGIYLFREQNSLIHFIPDTKPHSDMMCKGVTYKAMSAKEKKSMLDNILYDHGEYGSDTKLTLIITLKISEDTNLSIYRGNNVWVVKDDGRSEMCFTDNPDFVNSKVFRLPKVTKKNLTEAYNRGQFKFQNGYCRAQFQSVFK